MTGKALTFIRQNAIALCALFVALSGSSYAALSPGASRDVRHRTEAKARGEVRAWARVAADGRVLSSSGRVKDEPLVNSDTYYLSWRLRFARRCVVIATVAGTAEFQTAGFATAEDDGNGTAEVETFSVAGQRVKEPFGVVVVC